MKNEIDKIEDLIINNKLLDAANELRLIFKTCREEELTNESLLTISRLQNLKRKSNQGVIDYFDPEFNKIRMSIINLKSSARIILIDKLKSQSNETKNNENIELNLIFEENFLNNKNNWDIEDNNKEKTEIRNRRYFVENKRVNNAASFCTSIEINESKNFKIIGRFTFLEGSEDRGFGLEWGSSEDRDGFGLKITPDGSFRVSYNIGNEVFVLKDWTGNPAIKTWKKANVLEVIKNREILHFRINNEVVFSDDYISFFGSHLGVFVGASTKIVVDFFQVYN